jgi:hypothetical protein
MAEYACEIGCNCGESAVDFYDVMERRLMQMTFWAHKELLFDKIKQKIQAEEGEKLDKLADLLIDASKSKWKSEQEMEKKREELRERIKDTFEEE